MSMVSISLFSFNNFMVGVIFRLYGITYLWLILPFLYLTFMFFNHGRDVREKKKTKKRRHQVEEV